MFGQIECLGLGILFNFLMKYLLVLKENFKDLINVFIGGFEMFTNDFMMKRFSKQINNKPQRMGKLKD